MSIITTNPAKILIRLLDQHDLDIEKIFKLAQYIDAYEIEKQLQETLVIDIHRLTRSGQIHLIMTPKIGLTYDELLTHLKDVIAYAFKNANLEGVRWEILEISFQIESQGKASYVFDDLRAAFKTE